MSDILEAKVQEEIAEIVRNCMIAYRHPLKVFGLQGTRDYALKVADHLNIKLSDHVETQFPDGECYVKSVDEEIGNVRGHNVFVIQSLYDDENESASDKFMKLAFFVDSLRAASAYRISVVIPHLAWARQDRKTESRAPVSTQAVAKMLEAVGVQHGLFIDVHSLAAEQNAFRIPIDVLEAKNLHAEWCVERLQNSARRVVVVSPDQGGLTRANQFAAALGRRLGRTIEVGILDKVRDPVTREVKGHKITKTDVKDADTIIYDDMISTGGTIGIASKAVIAEGGFLAAICVTHGLFAGKANDVLDSINAPIVLADTVSPFRLTEKNRTKIHFVDTTALVAKAIWRIHTGTGSISELLR